MPVTLACPTLPHLSKDRIPRSKLRGIYTREPHDPPTGVLYFKKSQIIGPISMLLRINSSDNELEPGHIGISWIK